MPIKLVDKQNLDEALKQKIVVPKSGEALEAVVVAKDRNRVWVDIGAKSLGIISSRELAEQGGIKSVSVGDKILAIVVVPEDEEGYAILSLKRADRERGWRMLKKHFDNKEEIMVKVVEANRGGLMVEADGARGFLPVSQLLPEHYPRVVGGDKEEILTRLRSLVGETFRTKIITFDRLSNKIIFSEKATRESAIDGHYKIGDVITGRVSGIVDFGIFVNFDATPENPQGIEGLVHISEISWGRVDDPSKFSNVGDEIKVQIIGIEGGKVSLSMKRMSEDPWVKSVSRYKIGEIISGEVTKIAPFGAFVRIAEDVDGLVHISELADRKISSPDEILKEGEKHDFKIISIEPEQHRLGLSLKQALAPQVEPAVQAETQVTSDSIEQIKEISDSVRKKLEAGGIKTLADLKSKKVEDLVAIEGIGEVTAQKIFNAAQKY